MRTAELSLHDKVNVTNTTKHCGTTAVIVSSFSAACGVVEASYTTAASFVNVHVSVLMANQEDLVDKSFLLVLRRCVNIVFPVVVCQAFSFAFFCVYVVSVFVSAEICLQLTCL